MKPFTITCYPHGSDAELFIKVINQGIDAHLEAFTKSKFYHSEPRLQGQRLVLDFDRTELPILVRRLRELGTEQADTWANDIEESASND